MNEAQLRALLEQLREGAVDVDHALAKVRNLPYEDLGYAKVDHHPALRHGMPEVIFGIGKTDGRDYRDSRSRCSVSGAPTS